MNRHDSESGRVPQARGTAAWRGSRSAARRARWPDGSRGRPGRGGGTGWSPRGGKPTACAGSPEGASRGVPSRSMPVHSKLLGATLLLSAVALVTSCRKADAPKDHGPGQPGAPASSPSAVSGAA